MTMFFLTYIKLNKVKVHMWTVPKVKMLQVNWDRGSIYVKSTHSSGQKKFPSISLYPLSHSIILWAIFFLQNLYQQWAKKNSHHSLSSHLLYPTTFIFHFYLIFYIYLFLIISHINNVTYFDSVFLFVYFTGIRILRI